MDKVDVPVKRDTPPDWARDRNAALEQDVKRATQPQLNYIRDLIVKKNLNPLKPEERTALEGIMQEEGFWDTRTTRLSFDKARAILDKLTRLNDKPREFVKAPPLGPAMTALPPGRYALPKAGTKEEDNEIRFYNCWRHRTDENDKRLYVMFGPSEGKLPPNQAEAVANLIVNVHGIRDCAIRYGIEIRECSNCGRRLTNRISRELGIGPICGGRMFGDSEWKQEVKDKRAALVEQGIDPDEELDD